MSGISQAVALRPDRNIGLDGSERTCDVLVQYGILFNHVVDQTPRCAVEYQHFPLEGIVRLGGHEGREVVLERTSPWVTCRMVFRITALVLVLYDKDEVHG
jgi:hypothetical protein